MDPLYFDDLQEGDSWRSRARTITETDVVNFACLTGDFDPLHVDHEHSRRSPFGRPVVHGLLGMSYLTGLSSNAPAVHSDAFLGIHEWQFLKPLYIGDTIHVITSVASLTRTSSRRGRVVWRRQLVNQAGEVVQQGLLETSVVHSSVAAFRAQRNAA